MYDLNLKVAYETLYFDTADGELNVGQYCMYHGKFLIRDKPKNNGQFTFVDELDTTDMTEVKIIPDQHKYFGEYVMDDGRIYREEMTAEQYFQLAKISPVDNPIKRMTDQDVISINQADQLFMETVATQNGSSLRQ